MPMRVRATELFRENEGHPIATLLTHCCQPGIEITSTPKKRRGLVQPNENSIVDSPGRHQLLVIWLGSGGRPPEINPGDYGPTCAEASAAVARPLLET